MAVEEESELKVTGSRSTILSKRMLPLDTCWLVSGSCCDSRTGQRDSRQQSACAVCLLPRANQQEGPCVVVFSVSLFLPVFWLCF
jgi:hypothetical protein